VKEELALELVARYHGKEAALEAARQFARIFREKGLPEEIEEVTLIKKPDPHFQPGAVPVESYFLPHIMVATGTAATTSEARRLTNQGAVTIDGEKVVDVNKELSPGSSHVLKVGKRRFVKITLLGD
jgi:tyrosyl-tRNA synthetase